MQDFLFQSKLYQPQPQNNLVQRARLERLLADGLRKPLTLVSAPAGYGKSTLVGQWFESQEVPRMWLSLDADDSGFREFLLYFVAAIRTVFPKACPRTLNLLDILELPPVSVVTRFLSNEIDAINAPFLLVLDDYPHITESAVHDLLSRLLQHLPLSLHLVLVTRRDQAQTREQQAAQAASSNSYNQAYKSCMMGRGFSAP